LLWKPNPALAYSSVDVHGVKKMSDSFRGVGFDSHCHRIKGPRPRVLSVCAETTDPTMHAGPNAASAAMPWCIIDSSFICGMHR